MTGTQATAAPVETAVAAPVVVGPTAAAITVLHLLAPAALWTLLVSALAIAQGWSEDLETGQWVVAFAIALPGGIMLAGRQAPRLREAQAAWAIAAAMLALGFALVLRSAGPSDTFHDLLIGAAAAAALAAPWLARRVSPDSAAAGYATAAAALLVTVLLFIPDVALSSHRLVTALSMAGLVMAALLATARMQAPRRLRLALDVVLAAVLALVVISLPDIRTAGGYLLVHHQDFYLGPVEAIIHGRPMLDGTWSQYGVSGMDVLRLMFAVVPLGYGGLTLIVVGLTAVQYVLVYATLRMAISSQLLIAAILGAEVVGHLLGLDGTYLAVPSTSPLRFGLPYLVIAAAVLAARYPARARAARVCELVVLALSATWSFETFVYTAVTFALIVIATELAAGPGALLRIVRSGLVAAAISVAALLSYTLLAVARSGHVDWGPYLDYLKIYSVDGFGQLPIPLFSPGPIMGAFLFFSVAGIIHLARTRAPAATPPQLAALAGFAGAGAAFYTYYIGRSHPDNLLHILLPVAALCALWAALLLQARPSPARVAGLAALLAAAAMVAVMGWPTAKLRWPDTAFAQGVPYANGKPPGQGGSLLFAVKRLWHQPVLNPRAASGAQLLARHLPPGAPALVLTETDLTTETLARAGRRNVLPLTDPRQDDLIADTDARVRKVAEHLPTGTLMLTTPPPEVPGQPGAVGEPREFVGVQVLALDILHRRFAFHLVDATPDGMQIVRLQPHRARRRTPQRSTGRSTP